MKKICLISLLCLFSCKGQNTETEQKKEIESIKQIKVMKYFDIKRFEENQKNGESLYVDSLGNQVREFLSGRKTVGYGRYIQFRNTHVKELNHFYKNGILKEEGKVFYESFRIGIWKFYNEQGVMTQEIDYDKSFKNYPLEKVLEYLKSRNVDLSGRLFRIYRDIDKKGIPMWYLTWNSGKRTEEGYGLLINIEINAKSGERTKEYYTYFDVPIEDKFIKEINPIIIYDKEKQSSEPYRTHNGRTYTEEEWKSFEEQEYQKYVANKNKKGFWDSLFGG